MKKLKINYKVTAKYLLYFILFLLFLNGKTFSGFSPFGIGIYVALIFCKQNLFLTSLLYISAGCIVNPSLEGFVLAISPCVVLILAYFIHNKVKKPINMLSINIYAFLSSLVALAFVGSNVDNLINCIISIFTGQIFTYCCVIFTYALLVRGLKYKFNVDEIATGAVTLAVLGLSLFSAEFYNFNCFYMVAVFIVLSCSIFTKKSVAVGVSAILGLGVTLATGELNYAAIMVIWALVAVLFSSVNIYLSALGIFFVDLMLGMYFKSYPVYSYLNIVSLSIGIVLFILLPKKVKAYLGKYSFVTGGYATKNIVNRNRMDVANKLTFISNAFYDMYDILKQKVNIEPSVEDASQKISKNVAINFCEKCGNKRTCFEALGGDTSEMLEDMVMATIKKGKTSIVDMPPFITSRCKNINGLVGAINREIGNYNNALTISKNLDKSTMVMAEQMQGMSNILDNISNDIAKTVSFNQNSEQRIIDELLYHNVVCSEAIVYGENSEKMEVALVVREIDAKKKIISKVVSRVLKKKMIIKMNSVKRVNGMCCLELIENPNFDVVYGETSANKNDELVSGDSNQVQKISDDRIIIALSDGMGSGIEAGRKSSAALSMIESFYKAGFSNDIILSLVNKLLTLSNDESFTTLDMCVVDLLTGRADFIKLGASDGIIKHNDSFEFIESKGLPIGILDNINVNIESKILTNGDMVVVVSDGVTDVMSKDEIISIMEMAKTNNPQTITDLIIEKAKNKGASDDITAVVARMYNKVA